MRVRDTRVADQAGRDVVSAILQDSIPEVRAALARLREGATEDQLCDGVESEAGTEGLARLFFRLGLLRRWNLLEYHLVHDRRLLASVHPLQRDWAATPAAIAPHHRYLLSRFAYLRRVGSTLSLESPLAPVRVALHGPASAIVALLAEPRAVADVAQALPEVGPAAVTSLLGSLLGLRLLEAVPAVEPDDLPTWEFHDLLFHRWSRRGWYDTPVGGTFRFGGRLAALSACKEPMSPHRIDLSVPDLDRLRSADPPFTEVLEARSSRREAGPVALSLAQVGEFLYRTTHIKAVLRGPGHDLLKRPYPSGGAIHELEYYVVVNRCEGLGRGLYHYHALDHALYHLAAREDTLARLLDGVSTAWGQPTLKPDLLLVLCARFARLAWKYERMAYRVMLLNVGVALQTMYLVATAMNLAPCAIGNGDSELFAAAAGLDPLAEGAIGEFALSSGPRAIAD